MLVLVVGGSAVGGQALRGLLRPVGFLAVDADQDEGVCGDGVPGLGFQYAAICSVSGAVIVATTALAWMGGLAS